jgi:hypothetical protein
MYEEEFIVHILMEHFLAIQIRLIIYLCTGPRELGLCHVDGQPDLTQEIMVYNSNPPSWPPTKGQNTYKCISNTNRKYLFQFYS